MLNIYQNTTNDIIVAIQEFVTIDSPVFLWELINDFDSSSIYFISEDISNYKDRYNEFIIQEFTDPDTDDPDDDSDEVNPLIGKVTIFTTGSYHYKIYQQTSTTNLDPTNNGCTLIDSGRLKVYPEVITSSF